MDLSGLDSVVTKALDERHVPGLSVATIENDSITTRAWGFASASSQRPVDEGTIFEAASMSKPVTTYAVLRLVEEGLIDLDAPLCGYSLRRYVEDPRLDVVTARHALTHRSGLWVKTNEDPPYFEKNPAVEFKYSNVGFMYLQAVIEGLVGEPFDAVAHRFVLAPLEMHDSSFIWRSDYEGRTADPHDKKGMLLSEKWRPDIAWSPGSLHTTATDYAKFMRALLTRRGPVPANLVDEMLRPQVEVLESWGGGPPDVGSAWGLGVGLQTAEPPSFWHWGWNDGFLSFAVAWPGNDRGVVAFTNGINGLWACKDVVTWFYGAVHPAFRWLEH